MQCQNVRWFLFDMSPAVLAFKISVFTNDYKFLIKSKWILVVNIAIQILLTLLTFLIYLIYAIQSNQ